MKCGLSFMQYPLITCQSVRCDHICKTAKEVCTKKTQQGEFKEYDELSYYQVKFCLKASQDLIRYKKYFIMGKKLIYTIYHSENRS